MSLSPILSSALSGLSAAQQALRTTSNNIANANTDGYVREVVSLGTTISGGQVSGVKVNQIQRVVDKFLVDAARRAASDAKRYSAEGKVHDRLQSLLGRPDENTSLSGRLDNLFSAIASLSLDPKAPARRQTALGSIQDFADELSRLADQLQLLRADASDRIAADVAKANSLLTTLTELNPLIVRERSLGRNTGGLEEQRSQALAQLADLIDIRVSQNSDGSTRVTTANGISLLDSSRFELQYTPPGTVQSGTRFDPITVHRVNSVTGVVDPTGTNLDTSISSGSLRGLLDARDKVLPDIALTVGELAANAMDQLNAVHNANTAVPAPNSLVGRDVGLLSTDAHGFTGKATFAVVDASGVVVNSVTVDFDALAPTDTLATVVANVNAALAGAGTLALNNGVMSFTAANSANGVVIAQDAASPSARAGRGFAHFFGMNDLLKAQRTGIYETGFTTTDAHGFTAGGTANFEIRDASGTVLTTYALTVSGTTFNDLLTDLNTNLGGFMTFSMDAKGGVVVTPKPGFDGVQLSVTSDSTGRGTTGISLSGLFGIGDSFRMDAAKDVALTDAVAKDTMRLAVAKFDGTVAAGDPAIVAGDARGVEDFQNLIGKDVSFRAAGGLTALSTTLGRYGANVLSHTASLAQRVDDLGANSQALKTQLDERVSSVSGVNMDEELANMVLFQNSYNATARLIKTAQDLIDTLLRVV